MRQLVISTPKQIGQVLLARRKSLHLSQSHVAKRLGISQSRVSMLEAQPESITLDRLIAYANVLGLELVVRDKSDTKSSGGEW